ncbi:hypothetical protein [Mesorhizobium sp. L-8-10]|uniref:hypothetical protein n=1 Tax=Mesorhizobium sp. L-8-10 TaxID=2744523 RepID=UPI001928A65E|nr:hypothetical protein [Mesorhizobium sp. L-8-10]
MEQIDVKALARIAARRPIHSQASIQCGSTAAFRVWVDRQIPMPGDKLAVAPSFSGIILRGNLAIPHNLAVLLVDGEVKAIVKLDSNA